MDRNLSCEVAVALLLTITMISGCTSTGKAVAELEPGMTKQQVLEILGPPADRSFRGTDEAWQYQEIAGFGQCKYTTVWIADGKLVGISTRRGSSVAGCGLGSEEVDWSKMPAPGPGP
jgi:SmpA/OmlA family protein